MRKRETTHESLDNDDGDGDWTMTSATMTRRQLDDDHWTTTTRSVNAIDGQWNAVVEAV
jgi:hypothetical protein